MNAIDIALFLWFNSFTGISQFFDLAIIFKAKYLWYGVAIFTTVPALFALVPKYQEYRKKSIEFFVLAWLSAIVSRFGVTEVIRFFYDRPRPFEVLDGVNQLVSHAGTAAFPSGHAALSFAIAATAWFYYPKTSAFLFITSLAIGVGRVEAGIHWSSDILGGAVVGIISAWVVHRVYGHLSYTHPR